MGAFVFVVAVSVAAVLHPIFAVGLFVAKKARERRRRREPRLYLVVDAEETEELERARAGGAP